MTHRLSRREALSALAAGAVGLSITSPGRAAAAQPVKIGLLKSMFRDLKPGMLPVVARPLQAVILAQTGMPSQTVLLDTPEELRQQLADNELQLGVFHGFEFAWMRLKQANLSALMLSVINANFLRSVVLIPADATAANLGDLKGKTLAIANGCREHSRLFLARSLGGRDAGSLPDVFADVKVQPTGEDAMDQVINGHAAAVIVEQATWLAYQDYKPGRSRRLKPLKESETFPYSAVAYCRGNVDEATLNRFRAGMAAAHQSTLGQQLMRLMKMSGFEAVHANYEQRLADIVAAYPPV